MNRIQRAARVFFYALPFLLFGAACVYRFWFNAAVSWPGGMGFGAAVSFALVILFLLTGAVMEYFWFAEDARRERLQRAGAVLILVLAAAGLGWAAFRETKAFLYVVFAALGSLAGSALLYLDAPGFLFHKDDFASGRRPARIITLIAAAIVLSICFNPSVLGMLKTSGTAAGVLVSLLIVIFNPRFDNHDPGLLRLIAIMGILAVFLWPQLGKLTLRTKETRTLNDLSWIRGMLDIYAQAHSGRYPAAPGELTGSGRPDDLPGAVLPPHHETSNKVRFSTFTDDSGGWVYTGPDGDLAGKVFVNCSHEDSRGRTWSSY